MSGAFFGGFTFKYGGDMAGFVPLIHLIFLPITVIFGALFKTIIDALTRKKMPEDQLAQSGEKIISLKEDDLSQLISTISKYSPKSNSSKSIIDQLRQIESDEARQLQESHKQMEGTLMSKKRAIILADGKRKTAFLDNDPDFTVVIYPKFTLNQDDKIALAEYDKQCKAERTKEKMATQKQLINQYVTSERNEGKKLQHIILQHLFSINPKDSQQNTAMPSSSLN